MARDRHPHNTPNFMRGTKLFFKNKKQITKEEYYQLSKLHLSIGLMWKRFNNENPDVVLCKLKNRIVGWAIIFDNPERKYKKGFYIYVSRYFRREGIGTKIYKYAYKKFGKMNVSRWDTSSINFYEKLTTE